MSTENLEVHISDSITELVYNGLRGSMVGLRALQATRADQMEELKDEMIDPRSTLHEYAREVHSLLSNILQVKSVKVTSSRNVR